MKARALCLPVICLPNIPVTWDFSERHVNSTQQSDHSHDECPPKMFLFDLSCVAARVQHPSITTSVSKQSQTSIGTWGKLLYTNERDFSKQPHWKLPNWRVFAMASCWFVIDLRCMSFSFGIDTIECYAPEHHLKLSFLCENKTNICHLFAQWSKIFLENDFFESGWELTGFVCGELKMHQRV